MTLFFRFIQQLCGEKISSWTLEKQSHLSNKVLKCTSRFWWLMSKVGVFSCGWWVQLVFLILAIARGDTSTRLWQTCALLASSRGKEGPSCINVKAEVGMGFFLAPVGLVFQTCVAPNSCQRFLGTVNFLKFYFISLFINLHNIM